MTDTIYGVRNQPEDAPSARSRIPGEPGLWILIFGDMAVFTILFIVYLNSRAAHPTQFAESQNLLNRHWGAINTLVLLTSSLLVVFAVKSRRDPQLAQLTRPLTLAAAGVGACFVLIKAIEYSTKVAAGLTPSTNEFFTYYYVITGIHLFHVLVGLGVLLVIAQSYCNQRSTRGKTALLEGGACFWHLVDLLWIVIFPLLYLVR
ncbi:cytochrome c oxidase subunit 3 [Mycolicibacterium sp. XJ1819]